MNPLTAVSGFCAKPATINLCAGQLYTYKLEDGPIATAGFNAIGLMTIDKNDNIYLTDSYDKIKAMFFMFPLMKNKRRLVPRSV